MIFTFKSPDVRQNGNIESVHEGWENGVDELEELLSVVRLKEERIEELEEALRESVRITADRERGLQQEEMRRKQIMEKVGANKSFIVRSVSKFC